MSPIVVVVAVAAALTVVSLQRSVLLGFLLVSIDGAQSLILFSRET